MKPTKATETGELFYDQLRLALNNYDDPHWLGEESPLAAPYFLGAALLGHADADTAVGRGCVLQTLIQQAADALWNGPLPETREELETAVQDARQEMGNKGRRYYFFLIELRYLRRYFRPRSHPRADSEQAIRDYVGVGRGPYFNHAKSARQALGDALLNLVQPTFRLEQPPHVPDRLIGRELIMARCQAQLQANQAVALTGMGGVGKTSLAATIAAEWPEQAVFWFTLRPSLNDHLNSLLFSLGYFLHQCGASGLWLQLVADGGKVENINLALEQVRGDLSLLDPKPLLCLDEIDRLPTDADRITPAQRQFASFLESLRHLTPLLFIGQQNSLAADHVHALVGLTRAEADALLAQGSITYTEAEAARLHTYTGGNARLLWLCVALCQDGRSLTDILENLPETAVFQTLFARFWRTLDVAEQALLQQIAVFRSPAPEDAFAEAGNALRNLTERHILLRDGQGAVTLLPLMRELILEDRQRLPAEARELSHLNAAAVRAARGELTAAAYHFIAGGEVEAAIQAWYPQRQQEIRRGQAAAALALFEQLALRRLPEAEAEALALLRAELYEMVGRTEQGLAELEAVSWRAERETAVQAYLLQGNFLNALGQPYAALEKLEEGVAAIARLQNQLVRFRRQRTLIHVQQWQMQAAQVEAEQAQFTAVHLRGLLHEQRGQYDEAYKAYQQALALAQRMGHEAGAAQTQRDLADVLLRQGRLHEAQQAIETAVDYYERVGDRLSLEKARNTLTGIHFQAGEYEQVVAIGEKALPFFERSRQPYYASIMAANLAEACYELGELARAEQYAHKTLSFEEPNSYPYALYTLAMIRRKQKDTAGAEVALRQAQQVAHQNEDSYMEAYALRLLGEIMAEQGAPERGIEAVQAAQKLFERLGIEQEVTATQELLARIQA